MTRESRHGEPGRCPSNGKIVPKSVVLRLGAGGFPAAPIRVAAGNCGGSKTRRRYTPIHAVVGAGPAPAPSLRTTTSQEVRLSCAWPVQIRHGGRLTKNQMPLTTGSAAASRKSCNSSLVSSVSRDSRAWRQTPQRSPSAPYAACSSVGRASGPYGDRMCRRFDSGPPLLLSKPLWAFRHAAEALDGLQAYPWHHLLTTQQAAFGRHSMVNTPQATPRMRGNKPWAMQLRRSGSTPDCCALLTTRETADISSAGYTITSSPANQAKDSHRDYVPRRVTTPNWDNGALSTASSTISVG